MAKIIKEGGVTYRQLEQGETVIGGDMFLNLAGRLHGVNVNILGSSVYSDCNIYRKVPSIKADAKEFAKKLDRLPDEIKAMSGVPGDLKAALGNSSKPDLTHVRKTLMTYIARACEYGDAKYERANYMRPAGDTKENFLRYRAYARAAASHIMETLDAMELHQSLDPDLKDVVGMRAAMYAADTDFTEGVKVGASGLPHLAHAAASLMMTIVQAALAGDLPSDPGRPWE